MQLFSKTHLKNSRGGDTVSALGLRTHAVSGSRSVNSAHDSPIFHTLALALYFCGLEGAVMCKHDGHDLLRVLNSRPSPLFLCP